MLPESLPAALISALDRLPYVRPEDLNGRAVSYVRFSTPPQLMGDSQRRQVERCAAFIAAHGLTLIEGTRDLGRSAFKGHHLRGGGLGAFLAAVRAGTVPPGTVLVIEALDRLSRLKMSDALELFISILNSGIVIVTLMDGAWYSRRTIDENLGQIHQAVGLLMGAHAESRTKSDRGRDHWAKQRRNKATRNCPAWLEPDPDRKDQFRVIPDRVAVLRRIYEEFAAGTPVLTIVRKLSRDWRVPCWSRTEKRKTQGWYGPYVRKLLASRAVLGEFEIGRMQDGQRVLTGETMQRAEPIIDMVLWQSVQARFRTSRPGRVGMVRNLLGQRGRCGVRKGVMG